MTDTKSSLIRLRGHLVEEDEFGRWNLNDIWLLAKAPQSRLPEIWTRMKKTVRLEKELQKKVTNLNLKENSPNIPVLHEGAGRGNSGTFAHPVLAAAYAGYLSPKLEIETRQVWLRFRAGDPTLADEILQRASPEDNQWVGVRALGRAKRNEFTSVLQSHGVEGKGYALCTDAVYTGLFDANAQQLKIDKGLARRSANLRDAMDTDELVSVMFAESLSRKKIQDEDTIGNAQCIMATKRSTAFVRHAIEANNRANVTIEG
ncbi:KilA-N domain-containing protein [Rhizobium leguminosarum]|uniref:KilA-N domain-containing protein n=1 Tax=Rhizobium leguminosarum TaxID=384 RepID=UPI00293DF818|nr:KilA-N domain-containing protein [Rhizobium leguminosarum]MDV4160569.1 KilA-N domain-containing protein [Rhizobium leguminosarum]MDV4170298.1 KilA-N domain-containing protein [Rhizobium leguminosarum]